MEKISCRDGSLRKNDYTHENGADASNRKQLSLAHSWAPAINLQILGRALPVKTPCADFVINETWERSKAVLETGRPSVGRGFQIVPWLGLGLYFISLKAALLTPSGAPSSACDPHRSLLPTLQEAPRCTENVNIYLPRETRRVRSTSPTVSKIHRNISRGSLFPGV